ncbi:hypothetical protein LX86_001114 [Lentzea aerocolonigenes]|nr:hypothetical protein [Lentzea aerocolonigenes]
MLRECEWHYNEHRTHRSLGGVVGEDRLDTGPSEPASSSQTQITEFRGLAISSGTSLVRGAELTGSGDQPGPLVDYLDTVSEGRQPNLRR